MKDKKYPPNLYRVNGSWMIDFVYKGQRYRENIGPVSRTLAKEKTSNRKTRAAEGKLAVSGQVWKDGRWIAEEKPGTAEDPLFEDALSEFLRTRKEAVKLSSYQRLLTSSVALKPFFDGKRLSAISAFDIEKSKLDRRTPCTCGFEKRQHKATGGRCPECGCFYRVRSGSTVNRELTLLKAMLRKAVAWKWLEENPMADVNFYDEPSGRTRYLEPAEAQRLLSACAADFRNVVLAALHTGLRASELRTLQWSSVDMASRSITVLSCYAKNGETRTVPVTPDVFAALDEMRRERDRTPEDLVFVRRYGQPWKSWEAAWRNARDRAGLKDFRFHDLRHCYGSWLAMGNVADKGRMELMGHKTPSMSARYAHLSMDYKRDAVAKLPTLTETESPQISPSEELQKVVGFNK